MLEVLKMVIKKEKDLTRKELVDAANFLFQKYGNTKIHNGLKDVYDNNIYRFVKDVIVLTVSNGKIVNGNIRVDYNKEFKILVKGIKQINSMGFIK